MGGVDKNRPGAQVDQHTSSTMQNASLVSGQKKKTGRVDEYEALLEYVDLESGRGSKTDRNKEDDIRRVRIWYVLSIRLPCRVLSEL